MPEVTRAHRVFVTGAGAVTPAGDLEETWRTVLAGGHRLEPVVVRGLRQAVAGAPASWFRVEDHVRDARLRRELNRADALGLVAAEAALHDAALSGPAAEEAAAIVAVPVPEWRFEALGPALRAARADGAGFVLGAFVKEMRRTVAPSWRMAQVPNLLGYAISARLGVRGAQVAVSTACASGTDALGLAARMVAEGRAAVALAGGADCLLVAPACALLQRLGLVSGDGAGPCRPFDVGRRGLVPGEGAAFLVLESETSARRRGREPYAEVVGYGAAVSPMRAGEPEGRAEGFARAMAAALRDAGASAGDVACVSAHGTGTVGGDPEEARAIGSALGAAREVPVSSSKGALGYLGAASGPVDAALLLKAVATRTIPPIANHRETDPLCPIRCVAGGARPLAEGRYVLNSHGLGGQYASLVLGPPA